MANIYRTGYVYVQDTYAGIIKETDYGYEFTYDQNYLSQPEALPISITLPLREESYISTVLFPFFDGLIPEGWLLDVASRNWKLDREDRFGIMLVSCMDCIGDVSIKNKRD
jgi:serine/threonine-protein kinase HipA